MKTILILFLAAGAANAAQFKKTLTPEDLGVVMSPASDTHSPGKGAHSPSPENPASRSTDTAKSFRAAESAQNSCPGPDAVFLPTGFIFPALLPDAVYSYNVEAPVVALIEDDVAFRGHVVFPRGTKLVGHASTLHTLDRVNLAWELAVLPEGCEFNITAVALSAADGSAGIPGKLEKHEDSIAAQIALQSMITGAQAAATGAGQVEGAMVSGFSNEGNQTLQQNISKVKSLESITLHERMPIRVFVLHRFIRVGAGH